MNKIKYLILPIIVLLASILLYNYFRNNSLNLYTLENKKYDSANFAKNKNLFVYFSIGCSSCNILIRRINSEPTKFKDYKIFYVTSHQNPSNIKSFFDRNKIKMNFENVYIDKNYSFEEFSDLDFVIVYPTICIYDKNNNIKKVLAGIELL